MNGLLEWDVKGKDSDDLSMVADNIYTSSQHLIPTLHLLRPIYS